MVCRQRRGHRLGPVVGNHRQPRQRQPELRRHARPGAGKQPGFCRVRQPVAAHWPQLGPVARRHPPNHQRAAGQQLCTSPPPAGCSLPRPTTRRHLIRRCRRACRSAPSQTAASTGRPARSNGRARPTRTTPGRSFNLDVTTGAAGKVTLFLSANFSGDSRYHLDVWWDNATASHEHQWQRRAPAADQPSSAGSGQPTNPPPAATAFQTPTPGPDGNIIYVVQHGDTLVASRPSPAYRWTRIRALNGLTSDIISVGQRLIIGKAPHRRHRYGRLRHAALPTGSEATAGQQPLALPPAARRPPLSSAVARRHRCRPDTRRSRRSPPPRPAPAWCARCCGTTPMATACATPNEALLPGGQIDGGGDRHRPADPGLHHRRRQRAALLQGLAGRAIHRLVGRAGRLQRHDASPSTPLEVLGRLHLRRWSLARSPAPPCQSSRAATPSGQALMTSLLFAGGVVFLLLAAGVAACCSCAGRG